ncbi:MAG: type II and III secretion system protein family protein [Alphaproteobacteria bacterium]
MNAIIGISKPKRYRAFAVSSMALALAVILGLGLAAPAQAQGVEIVRAGQLLPIEVNKGRLIRIRRRAATVFIADPSIADIQIKSPTLLYVFGKKAGETTLFAVDARDRVLVNLTISVSHNLSQFGRTLDRLLPGHDVKVRTVGDSVVLSGSVRSTREAADVFRLAVRYVASNKKVINRLRVEGPTQVNLRVRIVEVSRNVVRDLGINWDTISMIGSKFAVGISTGGATFIGDTFSATANIQSRRGGFNNVFGAFRSGNHTVNGIIDALQTNGLIKTLAEPNLTAVSGETASFLAGGEFPIPVPQDGGVITVVFKKFGVGLSFTPTIIGRNRISLKVVPEVSQLSNIGAIQIQGINVPSLTTRRANTTVELASGQSMAIAGLIQNDLTQDLSKVPGIGDIPILGKLFTSENFRKNESELVIIITPYIVKPFNKSGKRQASAARGSEKDINRLFLGRRKSGKAKSAPRRLKGPAGFVLE